MKKLSLAFTFLAIALLSFGQNKPEAEKLVDEGVAYHDKGDYSGAISKYDKALELDKDNLLALTEKAFSLLSLEKYEESIAYCQKAIETHRGDKGLKTVYVTYGNAVDALHNTDQALEIYNEGIRQFPAYYQLYFNKGITLASVRKYEEAIASFQKSILINPNHASSHNAIARISLINNRRIPSLLAYCRFLVLEPQGKRAKENLASLQKIMKANVEETGKNSITINVSPGMLGDSANGTGGENNFSSTDLLLSMTSALDYDKKNKNETEVEQFIRKFETICASLKEIQEDNHGFFWDYYVPYFVQMKDRGFIETFAYVTFSSADNAVILKWLETNKNKVARFFDWTKSFEWKTN